MFAFWNSKRHPDASLYHRIDLDSVSFLAKQHHDSLSEQPTNQDVLLSETRRRQMLQRRLLWMSWGLFLSMAISVMLLTVIAVRKPSDRDCGIQAEVWSPVHVAVEYETRNFDNAFDHQTKYRGPPTPQLERAWEDLWLIGGIGVPNNKLAALNRTFDLGNGKTLTSTEDGTGVHSIIEVFHQLHCLNLIRQYTWRDWYSRHEDVVRTPAGLRVSAVGSRMHVDHCIEALRITLMCHADTTPALVVRDPAAPQGSRADFSALHKCRKFGNIHNWARENELSRPSQMDWDPEQD